MDRAFSPPARRGRIPGAMPQAGMDPGRWPSGQSTPIPPWSGNRSSRGCFASTLARLPPTLRAHDAPPPVKTEQNRTPARLSQMLGDFARLH